MDYISKRSGIEDPYNFVMQKDIEPVDMNKWFNLPNIKKIFNIPDEIVFNEITVDVYIRLSIDFMQSDCVGRLEQLLANNNFPVLYYSGQNDIIVCTICTEAWLDKVKYSGNVNNEFYNLYFKTWNVIL